MDHYLIVLDEATVNLVGNALAKLPYEVSAVAIANIAKQVQEQMAKSKTPDAPSL